MAVAEENAQEGESGGCTAPYIYNPKVFSDLHGWGVTYTSTAFRLASTVLWGEPLPFSDLTSLCTAA